MVENNDAGADTSPPDRQDVEPADPLTTEKKGQQTQRPDHGGKGIPPTVEVLRRRAKRTKLLGYALLGLIVSVLIIGGVAFYYAGRLQSSQLNVAYKKMKNSVGRIQKDYVTLQQSWTKLAQQLDSTHAELKGLCGTKGITGQPIIADSRGKVRESLQRCLRVASDFRTSKDDAKAVAAKIVSLIGEYQYHLNRLRRWDSRRGESINRVSKSLSTTKERLSWLAEKTAGLPSDVKITTSSALIYDVATRLTIAVLLLFLVQILVSMYRYSLRLAAFYDGRADALAFHTETGVEQDLLSLMNVLSPSDIDFGAAPKPPTEHAINTAKEIVVSNKAKR